MSPSFLNITMTFYTNQNVRQVKYNIYKPVIIMYAVPLKENTSFLEKFYCLGKYFFLSLNDGKHN